MANTLFSPTRHYVIRFKDGNTGESRMRQIYRLPDIYVNNNDGAIAFYRDMSGIARQMIISCVPYELHVENVRKQEEEASEHILVSPSRSYVIFTEDPISDQKDIYLVTLPYQYSNDEIGAVAYLYENRLPEPNVTNCLTFEMYVTAKPGIRPLVEPNRVVKVSKKNEEAGQDALSSQKKVLEDLRASVAKLYDEVELHIENLKK